MLALYLSDGAALELSIRKTSEKYARQICIIFGMPDIQTKMQISNPIIFIKPDMYNKLTGLLNDEIVKPTKRKTTQMLKNEQERIIVMKKIVKRTSAVALAIIITATICVTGFAATSDIVSSIFYAPNGAPHIAYGTSNAYSTRDYSKVELSTFVTSNYSATQIMDKVYVNWQMEWTDTGAYFGNLSEDFRDNATRIDTSDTYPLNYLLTTFAYHEVISDGDRVLSRNTEVVM